MKFMGGVAGNEVAHLRDVFEHVAVVSRPAHDFARRK
jgi:hypothetical protein